MTNIEKAGYEHNETYLVCTFCDSQNVDLIENSHRLIRVTSDCRPFPRIEKGDLFQLQYCKDCHLLTSVVDSRFLKATELVYSTYYPYRQGLGKEELTQISGSSLSQSKPRSSYVQDFLLENFGGRLPYGNWLDFGGGNGNFLKSAAKRSEFSEFSYFLFDSEIVLESAQKNLVGLELRVNYLSDFKVLSRTSYTVISLIHVFEHLTAPLIILKQLLELLEQNGVLLIQVPNVEENEYAIVIGDHTTHFSHHALRNFLVRNNFQIIADSDNVVPGESTFILGKVHQDRRSNYEFTDHSSRHVVRQLLDYQDRIRNLQRTTPKLGIFGTSIAGTWASLCRDGNFDYWVDESPDRVGLSINGKKTLSPRSLNPGNLLIVPQGATKRHPILQRLSNYCNPEFLFVP